MKPCDPIDLSPATKAEVLALARRAILDPGRAATTRHRILRTVSLLGRPGDNGINDTVHVGDHPSFDKCTDDVDYWLLDDPFDQFVYMIDRMDGWRARRRMQQKTTKWVSALLKPPPSVRQPQTIRHRRSAIFHAGDLPLELTQRMSTTQLFWCAELARYEMIRLEAIHMRDESPHELMVFPIQEVCSILPSTMAKWHEERRTRRSAGVKYDDRSWHGKPNARRYDSDIVMSIGRNRDSHV